MNTSYRTQNQPFVSKRMCPECGSVGPTHKKECSKYKQKKCSECDVTNGHLKTCSKYKERSVCEEYGGKNGHFKTCSKYKKQTPCPECGSIYGHKLNCSKISSKQKASLKEAINRLKKQANS